MAMEVEQQAMTPAASSVFKRLISYTTALAHQQFIQLNPESNLNVHNNALHSAARPHAIHGVNPKKGQTYMPRRNHNWLRNLPSAFKQADLYSRLKEIIKADNIQLLITTVDELRTRRHKTIDDIAALKNPNYYTYSPLLLLICNQPNQCMHYFLQQHVTLDLCDSYGNTVAHYGEPQVLEALDKHDRLQQLLETKNHQERTPLLELCGAYFPESALVLAQKGANVHYVSPGGNTPVNYLCNISKRTPELMQLLTYLIAEKKVDLNVYNEHGETCLHNSACSCFSVLDNNKPDACALSVELCDLLVHHGANIHAQSCNEFYNGETPLESAYRTYNNFDLFVRKHYKPYIKRITQFFFNRALEEQQGLCVICNHKKDDYKVLCLQCLNIACMSCRQELLNKTGTCHKCNKELESCFSSNLPDVKAIKRLFYL